LLTKLIMHWAPIENTGGSVYILYQAGLATLNITESLLPYRSHIGLCNRRLIARGDVGALS